MSWMPLSNFQNPENQEKCIQNIFYCYVLHRKEKDNYLQNPDFSGFSYFKNSDFRINPEEVSPVQRTCNTYSDHVPHC